MVAKNKTREEWLQKLVDAARPMFKKAGNPLPPKGKVRVAIGLPRGKKAIGECWSDSCAEDGAREIWVSPTCDNEKTLCHVLVHELCHAALPFGVGHKGPFVKLARAMHLEGKPTATVGGEEFFKIWNPILKSVGKYPAAHNFKAGVIEGGRKKQKTNLIKVACESDGAVFRITQKWIDAAGGDLRCPVCGGTDVTIG